MKQKLAAGVLSIVMVSGMLVMSASARAATCDQCGEGQMIRQPDEYTSWIKIGYVRCDQDSRYNDSVWERDRFVLYECNECGCGMREQYTETKTEHEHP